jgi:hypothetical protein
MIGHSLDSRNRQASSMKAICSRIVNAEKLEGTLANLTAEQTYFKRAALHEDVLFDNSDG